jgi:hypothetical protein
LIFLTEPTARQICGGALDVDGDLTKLTAYDVLAAGMD